MAKRRWDSSNPLYRWMQKQKGKVHTVIQKRRAKAYVRKAVQKAYKPKKRHMSPVRHMAKKKSHRSKSFLSFNTIGKFIKIGALVAPGAASFMERGLNINGLEGALYRYTGYSITRGAWEPAGLAQGWMPYIASSLIITGISKLNGIIKRL